MVEEAIVEFVNKKYIKDYKYSKDSKDHFPPNEKEFYICCSCNDGCRSSNCECRQQTGEYVREWNKHMSGSNRDVSSESIYGYSYEKTSSLIPTGIYECNQYCTCQNCQNKVTQGSIVQDVEVVYNYNGKGWGVFAKSNIEKGSFISKYLGRLISKAEEEEIVSDQSKANEKNREILEFELVAYNVDNFPISTIRKQKIEEKGGNDSGNEDELGLYGKEFVIDASEYGNLGRFFNHKCGIAGEIDGPNMFQQSVYSDIQDLTKPYLCFFAARDIYKGEELNWNYGYNQYVIKNILNCSCKSSHCPNK